MGRCYEFGISIDADSERAMLVAPQGGFCVCPSTGTTCEGRFTGCAAILEQANRVPPTAPSWAVDEMITQPTPPTPVAPLLSVTYPPQAPTRTDTPTKIDPAPQAAPTEGRLDTIESTIQRLEALLLEDREAAEASTAQDLRGMREQLASVQQVIGSIHQVQREVEPPATEAHIAGVHDAVEHLATMVGLVRQEIQDTVERHQAELHAVRREMIELRATIQERIEMPTGERLGPELRALRATVDELSHQNRGQVQPASQLAETINTLRGAKLEEISAAHLVHTFQLEIRNLRDELQSLGPKNKSALSNPRDGDNCLIDLTMSPVDP